MAPELPAEKRFEKEPVQVQKLYDNLYKISGSDDNLRSFLNSFNQNMEMPMRQEEIQDYLKNKTEQWNWGAVFRAEVTYSKEGAVKSLTVSLNPGAGTAEQKYGLKLIEAVQKASGAQN